MYHPTVTWLVGTLLASRALAMLLGELRSPELPIMYSASLPSTVESSGEDFWTRSRVRISLVDVADVAVRLRDVIVIVGSGKPAAPDEPEVIVDAPLLAEVGAVFAEVEGEDVYLPVAPRGRLDLPDRDSLNVACHEIGFILSLIHI